MVVQLGEPSISQWLPPFPWTSTDPDELLLTIGGYLIGAQVGLLGVVSISIALVSLIAQREGAETDVKVYYHESLAFELVASNVALLAVLCVQLLWPFQTVLSLLGTSGTLFSFKPLFVCLHVAWLALNLLAVAFFIKTTLSFVQDKSRQTIRERYLVNISYPSDLSERLRRQAYSAASLMLKRSPDGEEREAAVFFGSDFDHPQHAVLEATFPGTVRLHNVHMLWVQWVLQRWKARSLQLLNESSPAPGGGHRRPLIWFPFNLDTSLTGSTPLCFQRHGAELTPIEKFVLRRAFRFRSFRDEL